LTGLEVIARFEKRIERRISALSSPKAKHKKMRNSMDFTKIEVDGELLGVLNFNLMIPVDECLLQEIDVVILNKISLYLMKNIRKKFLMYTPQKVRLFKRSSF
jgi:hypothetical protein